MNMTKFILLAILLSSCTFTDRFLVPTKICNESRVYQWAGFGFSEDPYLWQAHPLAVNPCLDTEVQEHSSHLYIMSIPVTDHPAVYEVITNISAELPEYTPPDTRLQRQVALSWAQEIAPDGYTFGYSQTFDYDEAIKLYGQGLRGAELALALGIELPTD